MSVPLFRQMLTEAGVPQTESEMQAKWDQLNEEQGSLITNDSAWSPFWRLISAIVTEPCKQLVKLLIEHALPNVFLKYASGTWLNIFAWGVDLERKPMVSASGHLLFTRTSAAGSITVPSGTVVESPSLNGSIYRVIVTADTTIPDGELSASVPVQAELAGTAYNLGPGYYSILPVPVSGIASVANASDWLTSPGADEEKDEELRLRCRNQFSAVGQYHHDAAYTAEISTYAGIRTDYIWFEHSAPRGPGSANCYIMLDSGPAPQEFVDNVNAWIRDSGNHGHGDDMACFPMPATPVDLSAVVHPITNLTEDRTAALLQSVEDRIRCAFRENSGYDLTQTWPFDRFSFSRLAEELHNDLTDLKSVEFTPGDDILSGMALPTLNSLSVALGDE